MSIARITIMNFKEERDVKMSEEIYMTVQILNRSNPYQNISTYAIITDLK